MLTKAKIGFDVCTQKFLEVADVKQDTEISLRLQPQDIQLLCRIVRSSLSIRDCLKSESSAQ
ncbi:hypothetical protein NQ318_006922 [Aromia moschata]|uniref:Uncharacterized protein n=1 Tax=Aromia moschata TaxID=1265417 RepID=A0AAV8YNU0_9CUCU|nr:hypothetical protein NQ318_006922 [Aromia moschata]